MKYKRILTLLTPWFESLQSLEASFAAWQKLSNVEDIESSPLWKGYYLLFERYTDELNRRFGRKARRWLNWFAYDNDGGANGLSATPHRSIPAKPIRTLEDLAHLIAKS